MTTGRRARVANAAPRKPTVAMTPMSNMIDAVSTRRHPSRDLRGSSARADVHRPRTEVPIPTRRIAAPPTNSYCQGDPPGDSVVGGLPEKSFITSPNVRRAMAGDWHALRAEAVLQRLAASPLGLSSREARERLARVGPNELVQTARISPLRILLSQFTDVLVIVLIAAALLSAALGLSQNETADLYDALLIIVIVVMNAILGFVQEYRAERSLEALKTLAAPKAHVLREGELVSVPSRELVPGEAIVLTAGDRVPADARLLEVASLRVNEASLTGESLPVSKTVEPLPRDAFLGDRRNMVFMGTTVDGGRGKAVVVETGMGTELGKIAGLVQQEAKEETPLQRQLDRLGRQIGIAVLAAAGLIFLIGILREPDPSHIELLFLTAVGLAVAAIPEGLPAIVTISLAIGLQRMIRRRPGPKAPGGRGPRRRFGHLLRQDGHADERGDERPNPRRRVARIRGPWRGIRSPWRGTGRGRGRPRGRSTRPPAAPQVRGPLQRRRSEKGERSLDRRGRPDGRRTPGDGPSRGPRSRGGAIPKPPRRGDRVYLRAEEDVDSSCPAVGARPPGGARCPRRRTAPPARRRRGHVVRQRRPGTDPRGLHAPSGRRGAPTSHRLRSQAVSVPEPGDGHARPPRARLRVPRVPPGAPSVA